MRAVADDEPLSSPFIPYGPWETHEVKREEQILLLYEIHIFARSSVGVGVTARRAELRTNDPGGTLRKRNHEPCGASLRIPR